MASALAHLGGCLRTLVLLRLRACTHQDIHALHAAYLTLVPSLEQLCLGNVTVAELETWGTFTSDVSAFTTLTSLEVGANSLLDNRMGLLVPALRQLTALQQLRLSL